MSVTLHNPYAFPADSSRGVRRGQSGARTPRSVWLRGNLHMHTTQSDGSREPQVAVDDYARRGYDFIMLSDHDKVTPPAMVRARGMVMFPGNEVSARGPHLLHVNAGKKLEPLADRQRVIDAARRAGGFVIMNHPNWGRDYEHCPLALLKKLEGYTGIEIYNGGVEGAPGTAVATDKWDAVLTSGRIVWGYANDDSHHDFEVAKGWNMVLVRERSAKAIVDALARGRSYASTGVTIDRIQVAGAVVTIETRDAQRIDVVSAYSQILETHFGRKLTFDATAVPYNFIRFECRGAGGTMAWTQPFGLQGGQAGKRAKLLRSQQVLNVHRVAKMPAFGLPLTAAPWNKARRHGPFLDLFSADSAPVQTRVQVLSDGRQIRFAIDCDEPHMATLKTVVNNHNDPSTWADDSVEIFIDPTGEQAGYWQVMMNARGFCCPLFAAKPRELKNFKTRHTHRADGWRVEFQAPLAALGLSPDLGAARINIGRTRVADGRLKRVNSTWKWLGETFHLPENFGLLRWEGHSGRR